MANPAQSDPAADQAAAALYAEQYQQYTQQLQAYQSWVAANPGYQAQGTAPASTAQPDYSAYYQQYGTQPAAAASTQAQPQQAITAEEYAQQYAAYYAHYNTTQAFSSSAPPPTGAPAAVAPPPVAPYNGHPAAYQDYYAQQGHQHYSYPTSAPPRVQAHHHQYPGYQTSAPGTQPAPAAPSALTAYPYSSPQQQPPSAYSSSYSSQGPPGQNGNYSKPYNAQANSSHSGYQPGYQGKQHWNNKANNQAPFDNQAFQKQKHLEAEQRQKRAREEQDKVHIQQKLHTTTLNDDGYPGTNGTNMSKLAHEKPAYLSVKSKKSKPLTTNALEPKESSGVASNSEGWPQSLKDYVQRVFETIADEERDAAQKDLRDMVSKYHSEGKLWDIEWEKMAVPKKYKTKNEKASRASSDSPEPKTAGQEETDRRQKRQRRFQNLSEEVVLKKPKPVYTAPVYNSDVIDWDEYTIVGTSLQLEKNYLRLTSAPDPSTVRPVHVLQKTLDLLKEKWRKDQNYAYICDQFKSVRQDLTVQRIKSEFTVTVYEIHARIALEKGDLGEYNQCQTQLKQLYEYNLQGHVMEFTAYRILYLLHTRNPSDIIAMLASLTPSQKHDPAVKHALKVRTALASSNYHALFKLYISAPNMGGYLMDQFVERERVEAMKMICKAYRPNIEVSFLKGTLGFVDELECMGFLKTIGVLPYLNQDSGPGKKRYQFLDTKAALPYVMEAGKKYQTVDIKGQI
ncbi:hypothetical protein BGZ96_009441 [Linnemannia gamsii]|uniref:PCI domain-containing protein n=1 Tax=Linnemannia gamsii TaxID=64522 RepID=A0ABQ7JWR9_9FUNG|nr:hypothetical protein BGZ96_009441 [Linnemannia gamsii]